MNLGLFLKKLSPLLVIALPVFAAGFLSPVIAAGNLEVTEDKDRTTYSIGPSEQKKENTTDVEKERERAWNMLNNMNVIIDRRDKDRKQNQQLNGEQNGQR